MRSIQDVPASAGVPADAERDELLSELAALDAALQESLGQLAEDCREQGHVDLAAAIESAAGRLMLHLEGTSAALGELLLLVESGGKTALRIETFMTSLRLKVESAKNRGEGIRVWVAGLGDKLAELTEPDAETLKLLALVSRRAEASQKALAGVESGLIKLQRRLLPLAPERAR